MKKVIAFAVMSFCTFTTFAQNRINQTLDIANPANFKKISPFILLQNPTITANIFEENYQPSIFNLDSQVLKQINAETQFLEVSLPISAKENLTLELYEADIFAPNFKLLNSSGKEISFEKGLYFRGRIKGNNQSICAINISDGEVSGFISDKNGNKILKKLQDGTYSLYQENKLLDKKGFACGTTETDISIPPTINATSGVGCKIVDIYVEADNQLYLSNSSSIPTTTTLVTNTFNQVATLFTNENIEIRLSGIKVWDTVDPYTGTSTSTVLPNFRTTLGTSFIGTLAHLFSGKSLGGGAAYVDVLNWKSFAFGVSAMSFGGTFDGAFTYSPLGEITHELGHNFGSQHTHNCDAWNSGAGIDNCAGTYNPVYAEGTCTPANPAAGGGTIMSYCHLLSAIGTNYANGFGPLPGNLIRSNVVTATGLATSPSAPTTTGNSRCDAGTLSLSASACTGGTILWYNAATGGSSIGTGATFTTPSISVTTNYYANCTIGTCISTRTTTIAAISPLAGPITASAARCGAGTVVLTATGCSGGSIKWYNSLTGVSILSTATAYSPTVSGSTTYYASCTIGTCVSARTTFPVTVNTIPANPTVANVSRCGSGTLTLSATCGAGITPHWYTNFDIERTDLGVSNSYTTPVLASSTSYFVTCDNGTCFGSSVALVTINTIPTIPTVSPITIASGMATNLTSSGCVGTVEWFTNGTTTTPFATGINFTTTLLTTNKTYYFACNSGLCSSAKGSVLVTVSACPPSITMFAPTNNIGTGTNPFETSGIFTANNIIIGGNTKFDSASSIILNPGFSVSGGAVFRALIDGCGGSY